MKLIEQEIAKLNMEIEALVRFRARLQAMLKEAPPIDAAEPKKRGRKPKKVGLPSTDANQEKVPF